MQEPGCGARVKGAGLLHAEPEEGGVVSARKLKADAAINHRHRFRIHGEGCEGREVGGLEEVDLHLHVPCLVQPNGVIR